MGFFITLFCLTVLERLGAGLFLTLFRLLGQGFHRLDCSYWLDKQYMLCFCVMGPEAFWPVVYALVVFASLYCNFRLGCLRLIFTKALLKNLPHLFFHLHTLP
jgi:hypothetical protein